MARKRHEALIPKSDDREPDEPDELGDIEPDGPDDLGPVAVPPRLTRHVMPLGPRVLVRIVPGEDRTSTGLYLPPGAKDAVAQLFYGEVVEVARAPSEGEEGFGANVSGVPHGSMVLFSKEKGHAIPWDETLRLVDVKDILATVEEVPLDAAH